MMQQIRDWLYIGGYSETAHLWYLQLNGISAMLQLADYVPQPEMKILYLPVEDAAPLPAEKIKKGVEFILKQKAEGKKILLSCGAGVSRSVTFGIAALMETENHDIFDAYREILLHHDDADPHVELIISLASYYGKELDKLEAADTIYAIRKAVR
jgi:protein-tyrosine phosphatase